MRLSLKTILESAEENKQGRMIAVSIPQNIAVNLTKKFEHVKGDPVLPEDQHITICLFEKGDENNKEIFSTLKKFCQTLSAFEIRINEFGIFEPSKSSDNKYVLWAKPESQVLFDINDQLKRELNKKNLNANNGDFEFSPHITIKYCDENPNINSQKKIQTSFICKGLCFYFSGQKLEVIFAD